MVWVSGGVGVGVETGACETAALTGSAGICVGGTLVPVTGALGGLTNLCFKLCSILTS